MSSGGITWIADGDISWLGYCIKLARGLTGEQLAARLAAPGGPVPVEATTGPQAEELIDELDAERGDADSIAVRYGDHAGLGFALAYGHWPSVLGPAYHDGTSRDGSTSSSSTTRSRTRRSRHPHSPTSTTTSMCAASTCTCTPGRRRSPAPAPTSSALKSTRPESRRRGRGTRRTVPPSPFWSSASNWRCRVI
ncbi:hypothetical protein WKI71_04620 [Streptomyces sp. MS1.AVA.1]|uniref:Uncharacterized protein n=1 Tax=Streptomyces machairae TaxID=3134109 RepID=A0ABU8UGS5_9ACTN